MSDQFTATLNRFCAGLSEKLAVLEENLDDDNPGVRLLAEELLHAIRETVANLMLLELECERVLRHG
jgi:hypothetical protein